MGKGIDYGLGQTNIDRETGIRYGVIPMNSLAHWAYESFEPDYGDPHCPKCGDPALDSADEKCLLHRGDHTDRQGRKGDDAQGEFCCDDCKYLFESEEAYGDDPLGYVLDANGYKAEMSVGSDQDIFVTKSPYYTRAQFCSPCAPGACHLENPTSDGERAYCFGHDWFEGGVAPYPVFRVADDSPVEPEAAGGEDNDIGGSD